MRVKDPKIGQVESLIQHPGWAVIKEDLATRRVQLLEQLVNIKCPEGTDDNEAFYNFLRGRIDIINFIVSGYEQMVKVHKAQLYLEAPEEDNLPAIGSPFDPAGIDSQPAGE